MWIQGDLDLMTRRNVNFLPTAKQILNFLLWVRKCSVFVAKIANFANEMSSF